MIVAMQFLPILMLPTLEAIIKGVCFDRFVQLIAHPEVTKYSTMSYLLQAIAYDIKMKISTVYMN